MGSLAAPSASLRQNNALIYRPVGPKPISLGQAWTSGGQFTLTQQVDLSLPIRGLRFEFKGRLVVGTAGLASTAPAGVLNLISSIFVQGTNARQKGNITLWNADLASIYTFLHTTSVKRAAYYSINSGTGETQLTEPSTPWPTDNNPFGTTGTYDFRVVIDLPFHPGGVQANGAHPHWVPAYLVRNEEWKDSLTIQCSFPTVAGGAVTGPLGTGASGTTLTFSSYGSGSGNPTVDVYSLPIIMGLNLKDGVLPGILSRVTTPISTILQSAGTNVVLVNMQKQPTTRILIITGVSTVPPALTSLSDTNLTQVGILLGANRNVRNVVSNFAHKGLLYDTYERNAIQGTVLFDFMESGNPDSAYPGQNIGDGATFQLTGTVGGVANAQGIVLQEQTLHTPTGPLYTF